MEEIVHVTGDLDAQGLKAKVRGVAGLTFLNGADRRLANDPRSGFVRLAHAEGNDVAAADHEFKEVANAGTGKVADMTRDFAVVVHGDGVLKEPRGDVLLARQNRQ